MIHIENDPDKFWLWSGDPINGTLYPRSIERLWSADDLGTLVCGEIT